ncbi:MAG: patatin-like phospholipase family protein [Prevotellaceae bacterium]|jgi:NTE family protein|nr:patatin-like phospholipase family protein [Prevotellaceae bacterium]
MKNILLVILTLLSLRAAAENPQGNIGVVLSGGAARGFAHLGVLQALEDYGIMPTYVAGSSMGAVLGAIYASGKSPVEIYHVAQRQKYAHLYRPSLHGALFKPVFLEEMLDHFIPHNSFDSLQKKLYVCMTNLNHARSEIVSSGTLKNKVVASAAIPFVFQPSVIDGFTYVDGGLLNNLPVNALRDKCEHVIGISVNSTPEWSQAQLDGIESVLRAITMVVVSTELEQRKQCDFFIEVEKAGTIGLMEFNRVEDFYTMGYQATVDYIKKTPEILKLSSIKQP